jgi:hypothetical protein
MDLRRIATCLSTLVAALVVALSSGTAAEARGQAPQPTLEGGQRSAVTSARSCGTVRQRGGGGVAASIRAEGLSCRRARALLRAGSMPGWRFSMSGSREHARKGRRHISWVAAGC